MSKARNPASRARASNDAWRPKLDAILSAMRGSETQPPLTIGLAAKRHGVNYETLRDAAAREPDVQRQLEEANAEGAELALRMSTTAAENHHSRAWLWLAERLSLKDLHIATKVDATVSGKDGAPPVQVVRFPVNGLKK